MSSKKSASAKASARAERAAIAFAEAKKRERRRHLLIALGVVAAVAVVVGIGFGINALRGSSGQEDVEAAAPSAGGSDYGLVVGDDAAPHSVVIYEDFLCPICGVFESAAGERLNALIEQGQVQVDYRPISILSRFGPYSDDALNAFFVVRDAAGPEVAKEFHDVLYANQPSESGPFPDRSWLVDRAVEAGATTAQVEDGILNAAAATTATGATEEAVAANVGGTPTILLDGAVFNRGASWEAIADNLVAAIEQPVE